MPVKVNLYLDTEDRELVTDYKLAERITNPAFKLVLRAVSADHAREFTDHAYEFYPNFHDKKYFPVTVKDLIDLYLKKYEQGRLRIKRLNIKISMFGMIIEHWVGDTIIDGSRLFCGHCGLPVATFVDRMTFPFQHDKFVQNTTDRAFTFIDHAIVCLHCTNPMNVPGQPFLFDGLEEYFEAVKKTLNDAKR